MVVNFDCSGTERSDEIKHVRVPVESVGKFRSRQTNRHGRVGISRRLGDLERRVGANFGGGGDDRNGGVIEFVLIELLVVRVDLDTVVVRIGAELNNRVIGVLGQDVV